MSGIVKQLKKERDRVEQQLSGLNWAISAFSGGVYAETKLICKRQNVLAKARARVTIS